MYAAYPVVRLLVAVFIAMLAASVAEQEPLPPQPTSIEGAAAWLLAGRLVGAVLINWLAGRIGSPHSYACQVGALAIESARGV